MREGEPAEEDSVSLLISNSLQVLSLQKTGYELVRKVRESENEKVRWEKGWLQN